MQDAELVVVGFEEGPLRRVRWVQPPTVGEEPIASSAVSQMSWASKPPIVPIHRDDND